MAFRVGKLKYEVVDDGASGQYLFLIYIIVGVGLGVCLLVFLFMCCLYRKKRKRQNQKQRTMEMQMNSLESKVAKECREGTFLSVLYSVLCFINLILILI